jgi:hypothetical protein
MRFGVLDGHARCESRCEELIPTSKGSFDLTTSSELRTGF